MKDFLSYSMVLEEIMATKQKQRRRGKHLWHMTSTEFQAVTFVTTLILAAITILLRINDPVIWGFLATAIGIAIGQAARSNKNK